MLSINYPNTQLNSKQGKAVRVLVVDDSALMRKLISEMVNHGENLECVGTARDGEAALKCLEQLAPDVITLDVEMPNMNGIQFLEAMMKIRPTPVVMVSSLTAAGADITMACLQLGAVDFVTKPSGSISVDIAKRGLEIVQKIREAAQAKVRVPTKNNLAASSVQLLENAQPAHKFQTKTPIILDSKPSFQGRTPISNSDSKNESNPFTSAKLNTSSDKNIRPVDRKTILVAIASSTGGPAALNELLPLLPGDLNAAYLIVQHLPAGFTKSLADRLNSRSAIAVREAQVNDLPQAGLALIAPGGQHMMLNSRGAIDLNSDPPLWGVRPAADVMLQSVIASFGSRIVGVVMTGMGRDGALGMKSIHAQGGWCIAQNEATCVVYGMPRAAVDAGGIDEIASLQDIAGLITARVKMLTGFSAEHQAA